MPVEMLRCGCSIPTTKLHRDSAVLRLCWHYRRHMAVPAVHCWAGEQHGSPRHSQLAFCALAVQYLVLSLCMLLSGYAPVCMPDDTAPLQVASPVLHDALAVPHLVTDMGFAATRRGRNWSSCRCSPLSQAQPHGARSSARRRCKPTLICSTPSRLHDTFPVLTSARYQAPVHHGPEPCAHNCGAGLSQHGYLHGWSRLPFRPTIADLR